jgi:3-isopropylmalate dehydratase small subunit
MRVAKGKAWKFGHDLDRDRDIFPFRYIQQLNSGVPMEKLLCHVMETVNPEFGAGVRKGDFIVAGRNFGRGQDHREGLQCLKLLGISAIIAESIAASVFKHGVYLGLPIFLRESVTEKIKMGDDLEVNLDTGEVKNISSGETFRAEPTVPPGHPLFPVMKAGGQIGYVKTKVANSKKRVK